MKNKNKRNLRLRLALPIIVTVIISMALLLGLSYRSMKNNTNTMINNTMYDLVENCDNSSQLYMNYVEQIILDYSKTESIRKLLQNPNDPILKQQVQEDTENFAKGMDNIEGIYVAKFDSEVLAFYPTVQIVGKHFREGDSLKELQDQLTSTDGVYNVGIDVSKADANNLVENTFYLIKDDNGNPLGYLGCASFASNYIEKLRSVATHTFTNSKITLIDLITNKIMYSDDAEQIGQPANLTVKKEDGNVGCYNFTNEAGEKKNLYI